MLVCAHVVRAWLASRNKGDSDSSNVRAHVGLFRSLQPAAPHAHCRLQSAELSTRSRRLGDASQESRSIELYRNACKGCELPI